MGDADIGAQLVAKDRRIDELIEQAADLVTDLTATVASMKQILTAAGDRVAEQQRLRERKTRG